MLAVLMTGAFRRAPGAAPLLAAGVLVVLGFAASAVEAAFPGRNGKIAYDVSGGETESVPEIWTVIADGSQQRRFKPNSFEPAFSPDGRKLAFVRGAAIRLTRSYGRGRSRRLTHPPRHTYDESPQWAPAGDRLAFVRNRLLPDTGWSSEIRIYRRHSSRRLTDGGAPAWSSRGRIAFVREGDLYVVGPDGRGLRLVFDGTPRRWVESADWSPDGRRLVIELYRTVPDTDSDVATIKPDGTTLRRLTTGSRYNDSDPVFSPNGRMVAFARAGEVLPSELYSMRASGSRPRRVNDSDLDDSLSAPDWQPLRSQHSAD